MTKVLTKNPVALAVFELFAGFTGLDRIYMGCYVTGFLKMLLSIALSVLLLGKPENHMGIERSVVTKSIFITVLVIWTVFDAINVFSGIIESRVVFPGCVGAYTFEGYMRLARVVSYIGMGVVGYVLVDWLSS